GPKETGQPPKAGKEKPGPTYKFIGTLLSNPQPLHQSTGAEKILTVRTIETILVPNAHHANQLEYWRRYYLESLTDSNLARRIRHLQKAQYQIALHRAHLYAPVASNHNIDVRVDDDTKVRRKTLPPLFDDQGKSRGYTREELDRQKGPDKVLPGYEAGFSDLLGPAQLMYPLPVSVHQ